jgi:hypothetical protein
MITEEQKQDVFDAVSCAINAYNERISNWNGDDDGPLDKANERLGKELKEAIDKLF